MIAIVYLSRPACAKLSKGKRRSEWFAMIITIIYQSEEGRGFGSFSCISLSQHEGLPSPALVQRISVPQVSQWYLFPNCAMVIAPEI